MRTLKDELYYELREQEREEDLLALEYLNTNVVEDVLYLVEMYDNEFCKRKEIEIYGDGITASIIGDLVNICYEDDKFMNDLENIIKSNEFESCFTIIDSDNRCITINVGIIEDTIYFY